MFYSDLIQLCTSCKVDAMKIYSFALILYHLKNFQVISWIAFIIFGKKKLIPVSILVLVLVREVPNLNSSEGIMEGAVGFPHLKFPDGFGAK